jgi:hypothetical protein
LKRIVFALAFIAAGCGANVTQLTDAQERYLKSHPELGPRDRNALLYRTIAVGETLERVLIAWDGLKLERVHTPLQTELAGGHAQGNAQGQATAVDTYEAWIPVDGRPVVVHEGANEEEIPRGRVLLTFKNGRLATWVRLGNL